MSTKWYTKRDGNEYGPYSWDQLVEYAREGRVLKDDQVKSEEMKKWVKASAQTGLFTPTPPSAPPPAPAQKIPEAGVEPKPKSSPLKTAGIVVGSILGLLGLIFVILVAMNLQSPLEMSNLQFSDQLTGDLLPLNPTDNFGSLTDIIYLTMKTENVKKDSYIEALWYYEDDDRLIISKKLDLDPDFSVASFSLTLEQEWPAGSYRVDLITSESEGAVAESANFTVFSDTATGSDRSTKIFNEPQFDFTLAYPADWTYDIILDNYVMFKPPAIVEEPVILFTIVKNELSEIGGYYRDLEHFYEEQTVILTDMKETIIFTDKGTDLALDGQEYDYIQFLSETEDSRIRMWSLILDRGNGSFYVFNTHYLPEDADQATAVVAEILDNSFKFKQ